MKLSSFIPENSYNAILKKSFLAAILLILLALYLTFFSLMGNTYFYSGWSFRVVYPSEFLIENGQLLEVYFPKFTDTTFFAVIGGINNTLAERAASVVSISLASIITDLPMSFLDFIGFYHFFYFVPVVLFVFLFFKTSFKKESKYLFFFVFLAFSINPILFPVLNTPSALIFSGFAFFLWLANLIMKDPSYSNVVRVSVIGIVFLLFAASFYYTPFYLLIVLIFSIVIINFFKWFFSQFRQPIQKYYEKKNIPIMPIAVFFLMLVTLILIIGAYGPFAPFKDKLGVFLDIPKIINRFIEYYLGQKLGLIQSNAEFSYNYSQPPSYIISILGYISILGAIILYFSYFAVKKLIKHEINSTELLTLGLLLSVIFVAPISIATNALDRVPWLMSFCAIVVISNFYFCDRKKFLVLFGIYVLFSTVFFWPLLSNRTNLEQIYYKKDLYSFQKIVDLTDQNSLVWSDLKTSSYLVNNGRVPLTLSEGSYQGDERNIVIHNLYESQSKLITSIKIRGGTNIFISNAMESDNGFIYFYNFYLDPLDSNALQGFEEDKRLDKSYSGYGELYEIN